MAANSAPSVIRSQLASSVAPNFVAPPLKRAMVPSTMSKAAKEPGKTGWAKRMPLGIRVNGNRVGVKGANRRAGIGGEPVFQEGAGDGSNNPGRGLAPWAAKHGGLHS